MMRSIEVRLVAFYDAERDLSNREEMYQIAQETYQFWRKKALQCRDALAKLGLICAARHSRLILQHNNIPLSLHQQLGDVVVLAMSMEPPPPDEHIPLLHRLTIVREHPSQHSRQLVEVHKRVPDPRDLHRWRFRARGAACCGCCAARHTCSRRPSAQLCPACQHRAGRNKRYGRRTQAAEEQGGENQSAHLPALCRQLPDVTCPSKMFVVRPALSFTTEFAHYFENLLQVFQRFCDVSSKIENFCAQHGRKRGAGGQGGVVLKGFTTENYKIV